MVGDVEDPNFEVEAAVAGVVEAVILAEEDEEEDDDGGASGSIGSTWTPFIGVVFSRRISTNF